MDKTYAGARLRRLREERGLSQAELARRLAISPSYLNQIEHDSRPLTVPVLLRLTRRSASTPGSSPRTTPPGWSPTCARCSPTTGGRARGGRPRPPNWPRSCRTRRGRWSTCTAATGRRVEQLALLADGRGDRRRRLAQIAMMPHEEIRDFFYRRQNYLARPRRRRRGAGRRDRHPARSRSLAALAARLAHARHPGGGLDAAARRARDRRAAPLRPGDAASCTSPATCGPGQQAFRMAAQLALLEYADLITELAADEELDARRPRYADPDRPRQLLRRRADPAVPRLPRDRRAVPLRHRAAHRPLRRRLRDRLPPAQHAAAAQAARRAVLVRPGRPGRQHVQAPVRHRLPLLPHRRHVSAVERLRGVRRARPHPRPDRRMPDGQRYLWIARTVTRHAGRLRRSPARPSRSGSAARSATPTGSSTPPASTSTTADAAMPIGVGLQDLRTRRLPAAGRSRRSAGRSRSTRTAARSCPTRSGRTDAAGSGAIGCDRAAGPAGFRRSCRSVAHGA